MIGCYITERDSESQTQEWREVLAHRYIFFFVSIIFSRAFSFCGSSFFFLIFPPLSVTSRFSESLSANHLSFKLRFSGLSFNSPKSKLRRIFRKPGVFRNEIQVLLSNFASHINISSFFFSFETSQEGYFWSLKANFSFSFPGLKRLSIWNLLHPFLSCRKLFKFFCQWVF